MRLCYIEVHLHVFKCNWDKGNLPLYRVLCYIEVRDIEGPLCKLHSNFQGVISYFLRSYFHSKKEFKELFFRSKNDPKVGVKVGFKVTPKGGLSCT